MLEKQLKAFEKFKQLKVGALFMQMGTGKTKVALELVKYNNVDLLIYMCPFSSVNNIREEIAKWGINCECILVGYETIQSSDRAYINLLSKIDGKRCFVVADESIFIKNEDTKRFERAVHIRNNCEYALILNGTPLTKNEWDLYNQMFFLSPKILKMNRADFQSNFFKKITYKKRGCRENTIYKFSEVNASYLYELIEPYIFKADLDFKMAEKEDKFYIPYTGNEYSEEKERVLEKIQSGDYPSDVILNMLQSLNKISSCYEHKAKRIAEDHKGKQSIIYCTYRKEVGQIAEHLDCYIITGDTKNRNGILHAFRNGSKPLVMTYGVGSFSLNLQFCNTIAFSSLHFDYGKIEQAKYRIKRIGQENDINYQYYLTNVGINSIILESLRRKATLKSLIEQKIKEGAKWEAIL